LPSKEEHSIDFTTLTYINTLVIIIALATMGIILYAIRREHNDKITSRRRAQ